MVFRGAVAAALVAIATAAAAHDPAPAARPGHSPLTAAPHLAVIRPAPDFALHDVDGAVVRLSELRGRVVLVSFIYTRCTTVCPLLSARLALLERRAQRLPTSARPLLLSITVDPTRDSPAVLARYAARFGATPPVWRFLRDEPAQLAPVLQAWDEWTRPATNGELDHPARIFLIDQAGRVREIYGLDFFDERQAWLDIQALLRER
jgi:protein SCO1/2